MMNRSPDKVLRLSLISARARVARREDADAIEHALTSLSSVEDEVCEGIEEVTGMFFGRRMAG